MNRNIIYLEDHPYELTLPTGGKTVSEVSDWDAILDSDCELNIERNGKYIASWCLDKVSFDNEKYVVRGRELLRRWEYNDETVRSFDIGYRPMLVPLNPETLLFDPSCYKCENGTVIFLGFLVVNGKGITRPSNYEYRMGDKVEIKDTVIEKGYFIKWCVYNGKLIAVDNLMVNVSRRQLVNLGLVYGERKRDITDPILNTMIRGDSLGPNYLLLTVPAPLEKNEKVGKERILSLVAVKRSFMEEYAYDYLDKYLKTYDIDSEDKLEYVARKENAVAFSYRPMSGNAIILGEEMDYEKLEVLTMFIKEYLKFKT